MIANQKEGEVGEERELSRRGAMVLSVLVAGRLIVAAHAASTADPAHPPLQLFAPKPFPALKFMDQAGRHISLASFHGRAVLLCIWATWYVPCQKEMVTLDRLQAKLGGPHFQIVPVSIDTGGLAPVQDFYAQFKIRHLGIFLDPSGSAMEILNLQEIPVSFLIDPDGMEIGLESDAPVWDSPSMVRFLTHVISSKSPT
ncbi:TlpA family protein disulfide reductase [Acidiphilium sp. PA]|uniref:TlpA family protein disulfide reductase n=1 Tax=Acidiphilium sp. PA TaxID=2871705 RepID=UPI002244060A|nr:TlpA disulfide reductase family protein [Acidiphilium sp. PA]MCW8309071.1 TlpA family protein disulfide reductase [Acidiphilium sp. PA]